jgi:palmitoyltransferase
LGHGTPASASKAIAIIVFQFVLLIPVLAAWSRFFATKMFNPGYASPKPEGWHKHRPHDEKRNLDRAMVLEGKAPMPPGLEEYTSRQVFVCSYDGLPLWCNVCQNWKPDRAHHCSELNRCIRRLDHFCPWIGGVVTDTTHKFFVQFAFYAFFYCLFVCVVSGLYLKRGSVCASISPSDVFQSLFI